jgi:hypothetical protein
VHLWGTENLGAATGDDAFGGFNDVDLPMSNVSLQEKITPSESLEYNIDNILDAHEIAVGAASEAALKPVAQATTAREVIKEISAAIKSTAFTDETVGYQSVLKHSLADAEETLSKSLAESELQEEITDRVHQQAIQAIAIHANSLKRQLDAVFQANLSADRPSMDSISRCLEKMNASLGEIEPGTKCQWVRDGEVPTEVKVLGPGFGGNVKILEWDAITYVDGLHVEGYTKPFTAPRGELEAGNSSKDRSKVNGRDRMVVEELLSILNKARGAEASITGILRDVVRTCALKSDGVELFAGAALKSFASAARKVLSKYGGDPGRLSDCIRYTIFAASLRGLAIVLHCLMLKTEFDFVRSKHRMHPHSETRTGYR